MSIPQKRVYLDIILKTDQGKEDLKSMQFFIYFLQRINFDFCNKKRYKMVTLDRNLELLIYKGFLFSKIFRVAKFDSSLVFVNWSNKGRKSKVRRDAIRKNETFVKMYLYHVWKTCMGAF